MNYFLILFVFILVGCSRPHRALDTVFDSYSKKVEVSEGFQLFYTNSTIREKKLEEVFMSFNIFQKVNVSQGRKIYIKAQEGLIDEINQSVIVRPYIKEYPIKWGIVNLDLSFFGSKGRIKNELACITRVKDKLYFAVLDEKTGFLEFIYSEPFEDSLKIVHGLMPDPYLPNQ